MNCCAPILGAGVTLRQCTLALCVLAALSVRASAQTPPPLAAEPSPTAQPAPAPETPAATMPEPVAPPAPSDATTLPTITVSAQRQPPKRNGPAPPREAAPAAMPTPPSPYETGAPNVAGGTPIVPQMASQMVISGEALNSRPVAQPLRSWKRRPVLPSSSILVTARPISITYAATISITAPT